VSLGKEGDSETRHRNRKMPERTSSLARSSKGILSRLKRRVVLEANGHGAPSSTEKKKDMQKRHREGGKGKEWERGGESKEEESGKRSWWV